MIVVTGAAGFIGSNIVADLEEAGIGPIAVCDWFGTDERWRNIAKHRIEAFIFPENLPAFLGANSGRIRAIIHMGAISATTERDVDRLIRMNIQTTVDLWDWCAVHAVPFIYASSAATYGARETGLFDDESPEAMAKLQPLNAYGWSKKATDDILLARVREGQPCPPQWAGLKFFNVYGPNEYHKGDMMSVIAKLFDSVRDGLKVRLFKSDREGIEDGEQKRDFIYVKDCTASILWLLRNPGVSGIYNLGTGKARSFVDLARGIGLALNKPVDIEFFEMPESLKGRYQYFTQAEMGKFRDHGLDVPFHDLEQGISDYVHAHLAREDRFR